MMAHTKKITDLLSDLGRSTKRGVKKCPSCGTYNGTRTVTCKTCDLLLKPNSKRVSPPEVCRLLTPSSSSRIFSYISCDEVGSDERGFIHFPEAQRNKTNGLDTGICLVSSCCRSFDSNVLKCHESALNTSILSKPCKHVLNCLDCNTIGVSLEINQQVLESFRVPQMVKQEVWSNFIDKKKPYLQRVSENIFVVRCKTTSQNPLGYLHCIIGPHNRCFCCTTTLVTVDQMDQIPDLNTYFCCHYIACLSAIASSRFMVQEFEKNLNAFVSVSTLSANIVELDNLPSVQVSLAEENSNEPVTFFDDQMILASDTCVLENIPSKFKKTVPKIVSKKRTKNSQGNTRMKKKTCFEKPEDINPNPVLYFEKWLSSVTERINQEMHYQFDGNPPTMVFHIHKTFFDCLRDRMCASSKKRLPDSTLVFENYDSIPLGTFTKHTWHITNILLVKKIFETPLVSLKIRRSFIKNADNNYDAFEHEDDEIPMDDCHPRLQPNDLKTFLNVGKTSPLQTEPTPFIIEWIPDVLPITEFGELRLTFKYGHVPPKNSR